MGMFEIAPPGKYIEIKDRMYIPEDILNEVKSDLQ
jgi:hypothetical protein